MGLRGQHEGSFETAHALAREGRRFRIRRRADRGALRSRRGRRRHQRACRRPGSTGAQQAAGAHPHPRQSRRFRRPRQAQRVHARRPPHHRLRRQPVVAVAQFALRSGREGPAARARRRHQAVRDRVRARALSVARAVARHVLRARGVRPRRAGDRRCAAHERRRDGAPAEQRQAAGRIRRGLSDLGGEQGAVLALYSARARSAGRRSPRRKSARSSSAPATATI